MNVNKIWIMKTVNSFDSFSLSLVHGTRAKEVPVPSSNSEQHRKHIKNGTISLSLWILCESDCNLFSAWGASFPHVIPFNIWNCVAILFIPFFFSHRFSAFVSHTPRRHMYNWKLAQWLSVYECHTVYLRCQDLWQLPVHARARHRAFARINFTMNWDNNVTTWSYTHRDSTREYFTACINHFFCNWWLQNTKRGSLSLVVKLLSKRQTAECFWKEKNDRDDTHTHTNARSLIK